MVKRTAVPKSEQSAIQPTSKKTTQQSPGSANQAFYQQSLFFSLALDMTWQLALVVIIPIVGGFLLDRHFHTTPWLTVIGFAVAGIGVFGVLTRIVSQATQRSQSHTDQGKT
jgi:F0F1-type ATP synthase assembly protein I